ncbi:MAG: tRNA (adenosine(37)-N6)-threonylcarbamoyltransferase complex ATPase subunit type 1 TsaE [Pirellulales bacterium]|nr:tRNA (adenosine(37)-N6)-threonylcarbamoyltransferase complex ATPase subunit type 1 TsaE [Pirellulales bacterium]
MDSLTFDAHDETETHRFGAALARALPDGTTVSLCGTLGAGKTRLVQTVAEACGVERRAVVSPTFVLIHEYQGRRPVYHIDAYRIRDEDEFDELGPEEYFEGNGITLVEWADRVEPCMPPDRLDVQIEVTGEHARRFEIRALGRLDPAILNRLRESLTPTDDGASGP